jgi:hypothetical protein
VAQDQVSSGSEEGEKKLEGAVKVMFHWVANGRGRGSGNS